MQPMVFDLQLFTQSPSANFTATGVGKETTFGTAVTPTVWVSAQEVTPNSTNDLLDRNSARNQVGQELPDLSTFTASKTLTIEGDPDVIGTLFSWSMGTESIALNATAKNPTVLVKGTLSSASAVGAVSISVGLPTTPGSATLATLSAQIGNVIQIGGTAATTEFATLQGITGTGPYTLSLSNFQGSGTSLPADTGLTGLRFAHTSSAFYGFIPAYDHTLTYGIPRPTFTTQAQRNPTDVLVMSGGKISTFDFTLTPRQIFTARFNAMFQVESAGTASTPAFSLLRPYRSMDPANVMSINGAPSPVGVLSATFNVNNAVQAGEFVLTGGRLVNGFPEGQAKATGSLTVQYTSAALTQLFWGGAGSTGPQSSAAGITAAFSVNSRSLVNGAVNYAMQIILGNVVFTAANAPIRAGSYIRQTINFACYETVQGAGDDFKMIITNASAVAA